MSQIAGGVRSLVSQGLVGVIVEGSKREPPLLALQKVWRVQVRS